MSCSARHRVHNDWKENTMGARLTHIALHVNALDDCIRFYERYCDLQVTDDQVRGGRRVVLMAEPGRESEFVMQLIGGGEDEPAAPQNESHLGFAADSKEAVDEAAAKGREEGIIMFEPEDVPFPIGYICGLRDPNGNTVEISYGHLIDPGA
jgi:catechol 2,3-dioxygenase-like lactoylglutathione lyase family enzyme